MKKLLFIVAFSICFKVAVAQHYGGITFSPCIMRNELLNYSVQNIGVTFGYTVGYQGLIMPHKRFSFSYGFQYADFHTEGEYNPPKEIYNPIVQSTEILIKQRSDFELLQIPLWWRYNILKNKREWQPYLAVSTTIDFPITGQYTYYTLENPPREVDMGLNIGVSLDFGFGVNYYLENWCFSGQLTYSSNPFARLGLGLSLLRKF